MFHLYPAPTGPATRVHAEPSGSQSLYVTWQPPVQARQNGHIKGYYIGWKKYNTTAPYMYVTKATEEENFRYTKVATINA